MIYFLESTCEEGDSQKKLIFYKIRHMKMNAEEIWRLLQDIPRARQAMLRTSWWDSSIVIFKTINELMRMPLNCCQKSIIIMSLYASNHCMLGAVCDHMLYFDDISIHIEQKILERIFCYLCRNGRLNIIKRISNLHDHTNDTYAIQLVISSSNVKLAKYLMIHGFELHNFIGHVGEYARTICPRGYAIMIGNRKMASFLRRFCTHKCVTVYDRLADLMRMLRFFASIN